MALFRDWRSPGEKWIRTDFGWRRLAEIRNNLNQQLRRQFGGSSSSSSKTSSAGSSKKVSRATNPLDVDEPTKSSNDKSWKDPSSRNSSCKENDRIELQVKYLRGFLDQRCVSARSTSRESSNYSTAADAISKLNFEQALNNDGCFPFVCQVIALVFEQAKFSGSMQNTLLRLTDRAKDICIASRKHSGFVMKMIESALSFFEKLRQSQFTGFGVRNVDSKIKSVLKMKHQFQSSLYEDRFQNRHQSLELTDLPVDCLQYIASYLTHPRDLLNLGMINAKMQQVCEDNYVWRGLTLYHYGQVKLYTPDWKNTFIVQYRDHDCQLKCELSAAVCVCSTCNFVFWKAYGHPCLSTTATNFETESDWPTPVHQHLTPGQFLQLFVF